ncbi:PKD domain-containing protein [Nitrosomonas sp.]|uniref:Vgb family protein n=1 Tax=Nitrosomonas sp. TaxID=42353 RepID=UPI00263909DB|nr:PKD domain-containing protein [Nitrosomonas sp.]
MTGVTVTAGHIVTATATVDFGGGSYGSTSEFSVNVMASIAANNPPTANAAGPYAIAEGENLTLNAGSSSDPEGDTLTYAWDLDNDGSYGEVDEPTTVNPTVTWATLQSFGIADNGSYTIGLRVSDGTTPVTTTATANVSNTAPTLTVTGNATASNGGVYTLNLSAVDPGADTISGWTINWGDGTVQTVTGSPATITHSYTKVGFTYDILATATDEDGTATNSEVLVASMGNDSVHRLDGVTGALIDVLPANAALDGPGGSVIGPDGRLYVSGYVSNNVVWYDLDGGTSGVFIPAGTGGLATATDVVFGGDGNLYVTSYDTDQVLRYNGTTGAFIDVFASGLLDGPTALAFGTDGHLYVGDWFGGKVYKFDGVSGAQIGAGAFATSPSGFGVSSMGFGPDGHLYVGDAQLNNLLKFNGTTGAYLTAIDTSISPYDIETGPDGTLYVTDFTASRIERFDTATGTSLGFFDTGITGLTNPIGLAFTPELQVTVVASAAPTITNLTGDSLADGEGDGMVVIEQGANALVSDADSANFDTGTLTVSISSGLESTEDVLSIQNQGSGAGQIGVNGSDVTYQGVIIGTFTGGSNGSNLVITLNDSATPVAVTALVQNIAYENVNTATPTTGTRTVRYVLTDGDGGTSANYDTIVTVSDLNNAPVAAGGSVTGTEDTPYVFSWADFTITDVDSPITGETPPSKSRPCPQTAF